jgi:hypothetical protein
MSKPKTLYASTWHHNIELYITLPKQGEDISTWHHNLELYITLPKQGEDISPS